MEYFNAFSRDGVAIAAKKPTIVSIFIRWKKYKLAFLGLIWP
jgi:hypothetical protein